MATAYETEPVPYSPPERPRHLHAVESEPEHHYAAHEVGEVQDHALTVLIAYDGHDVAQAEVHFEDDGRTVEIDNLYPISKVVDPDEPLQILVDHFASIGYATRIDAGFASIDDELYTHNPEPPPHWHFEEPGGHDFDLVRDPEAAT